MGLFHSFIFVSLLTSTTLAINIPSTPAWPSNRCTDKSLTIPSWIVSNYKVVSGKATFQVDNRASETSDCCAFITCSPGKKECQGSAGANEYKVTWTKGDDGKDVIGINEFWTCGEVGDKTIFTATGNTTITSCTGSDCVSPITYLAYGTLILPVPLTPAQPSPPHGYKAPTCTDVGKNLWTVSSVEYKNYTKGQCTQWYLPDQICLRPEPAGGNFISKGEYLTLKITNKAISHDVLCNFTASYEKGTKLPTPLRCTGSGNFNEITLDVTLSGTGPNFSVKVEELWYCLENPATNVNASVIVASGSIPLPLTCESHTGITGTPDDIVTVCSDPVSSHSIDGIQVAKETLPPFSLITAYPVHGGCTYDSVINPTFYYRSMYFVTSTFSAEDPNNVTLTKFTAGLRGPGFPDYWFYEKGAISGSGVNSLYPCTVYYDGKPKEEHYNCTYSFNPHTKTITQDKVWKCSDKNPSQPLYFDGSGSFNWGVYPNIQCNTCCNMISCYWTGDYANSGIPYDIPKVTASLANVLPPDYGRKLLSDTVRVNGKWKKVNEET